MDKGTNEQAMEGAAASERSNVSPVNEPVQKRDRVVVESLPRHGRERAGTELSFVVSPGVAKIIRSEVEDEMIEVIKRKMKATADDQGRNTRMKDSGEQGDEAMRMDELDHEEEETNLYALQRLKRVEANEEIFRNLGLPGTLNGDSRNKVPNKGRGQKSSTPKATSPVTGRRGSKRVLAAPQEVPRLTRQRARELSAANPVEGTQEDSTQEEIRTTPKGTGRSGKDLERINKGMDKKLAIHISEGKKRPEVPLQAAKLATEGGIVLRRHIPVLPHWKMYRDERE
ncbi:hypothetical protein EJB05_36945, partial [Eragrostis curvula]